MSDTKNVPPREILFSLPTLENVAPALVAAAEGASLLLLHEDDWRQIELVSAAQRAVIDEEMTAIRTVVDERVATNAFRRLHVRERIVAPLDGVDLPLDAVLALGKRSHEGVGFGSLPGQSVIGGFALTGEGGVQIYGVAQDGRVTVLCLDEPRSSVIAPLREERPLLLVDWCRTHVE